MNIPTELFYSDTHEWIKFLDNGHVQIGLTAHAAEAMGDLVYLEVMEIGEQINSGESFGALESVKASSELFSPVAGEIVSVNTEIVDAPEKITDNPYACWLIELETSDGIEKLLTAEQYETLLSKEG